ncbi:MAG: hypothetical protein AAF388_09675 [Bacteroidota bacterium]
MKDHPQIYKVQGGTALEKNLYFFYRMYVYGHDIKGLGSFCPGESKEAPDGYKSIVGGK